MTIASFRPSRGIIVLLGLALSIVANAYVGTGLAAATMIFYRDRFLVAQKRTSR